MNIVHEVLEKISSQEPDKQRPRNVVFFIWYSGTTKTAQTMALVNNDLERARFLSRSNFLYRKNSKNWDTLNYYCDCPTNGIVGFYSAILRSKDAGRITNRVDTDQTAP